MKYFLMGSFASESFFWYLFNLRSHGKFDVIEISALSQSAELPVWFPIECIVLGMLVK
jgi:NADH-quinone oxidoreductase subunit N